MATPQTLPKKRAGIQSATSSSIRHNTPSSNRIISNRVILNRRHVSRSNQPGNITGTPGGGGAGGGTGNIDDSTNDTSLLEDNNIGFNENKHVIMSNFEEWIKMATDNKITSKNSWNFDLIDYFHDLNVIKDGESINFQRASATLDGCVKIYSSRVESAASETGKLLSGLAKKKEMENNGNQEDNDDDDDDENNGNGYGNNGTDGENGEGEGDLRKKRKFNRIVESTLVGFDTIRIKKLEQELAIDPLFKKALAEFDEGGAKSLLLNTLNVDTSGRVVFDATSNPIQETQHEEEEEEEEQEEEEEVDDPDIESAIGSLANFLFKDEEDEKTFQNLTICPSLGEFQSALTDINQAKSILSDFNTKMNAETQEHFMETFTPSTDNNDYGFNDELNDFGGIDFNDEDDDDNNNNNETHNNSDPFNNVSHTMMQTLFKEPSETNIHLNAVNSLVMDQELMAYFDDRMKSNWRGPEHWKVSAFKKAHKIDQQLEKKNETNHDDEQQEQDPQVKQENGTVTPRRRKPENVIIDFFNDEFDEDELFEPPKNINTINKKYTSMEMEFKLPDDIRYNSARLTNLFSKPHIPIMHHSQRKFQTNEQILTDENFFAEQYKEQEEEEERERLAHSFHQAECEDFDNDFGDVGGIDFNDALEADPRETVTESQQNIIGKRRPEYVNFSRVAKRVDVKLLKDNLWKGMQKEILEVSKEDEQDVEEEEEEKVEEEPAKEVTFGNVVKNVLNMYNIDQAKDISTSFCFICVLHLANEHGLKIKSTENHESLSITGF